MTNRLRFVLALMYGKVCLEEGSVFVSWGHCYVAMDLSDGLIQDLLWLVEFSDVYLCINVELILLGEEAVLENRLMV